MEQQNRRFLVVSESGPVAASADTHGDAVTACLWLEQQEEHVGKPLTGGRFRIVDSLENSGVRE